MADRPRGRESFGNSKRRMVSACADFTNFLCLTGISKNPAEDWTRRRKVLFAEVFESNGFENFCRFRDFSTETVCATARFGIDVCCGLRVRKRLICESASRTRRGNLTCKGKEVNAQNSVGKRGRMVKSYLVLRRKKKKLNSESVCDVFRQTAKPAIIFLLSRNTPENRLPDVSPHTLRIVLRRIWFKQRGYSLGSANARAR